MTTAIRLALLALVLVILLGIGAWYYLFGPNKIAAADLVPADTLIFATIPNAARLVADYETSQLKKLVEEPDAKPMLDSLTHFLGPKNLDLLQTFLPNLSGQSFVAITHFDPANPKDVGFIAGLKPKPGAADFNEFVAKLKEAYPGILAQGTTGAGQVDGLDYQWIQGPGASDKICVAQHGGWIITAWGENALRDWWERWQKKSATPSLAQSAVYQKSLDRVGLDSESVLYLDYHALLGLVQGQMAKTNPASAKYFASKLESFGAVAVGTKFENGEIADHFSMLIPRQAQLDLGMPAAPCPFDTLKFTGPDTRFYWGSVANFSHAWQNLQEQAAQPNPNPRVGGWVSSLQSWAQSKNLDVQRNIVGPLGNEFSLQVEWSSDNSYPDVGLFVKLDKPDDFKPTIAAILDTVRQAYVNSAVINEINSDGQNFATLKFIQAMPISPTITEDGPYLGVFLTENQAVRSFKRDASIGLLSNDDFKRQIGDRQKDASQMIFLDSPRLLDRGYQAARPYVPLASMFNPTLGSLVQGRTLPADLHWLDPITSWSFVVSSDDDGFKGYSVSGIGNQGIFLAGGLGAAVSTVSSLIHPPVTPPPFPISTHDATVLPPPAPPATVTPDISAPAPVVTNAPPAPDVPAPADATNTPTATPLPPISNAAPPAPAPVTNQ